MRIPYFVITNYKTQFQNLYHLEILKHLSNIQTKFYLIFQSTNLEISTIYVTRML